MQQLTFIMGPCMAESETLLSETADFVSQLSKKYSARFVFKASFDKANRTSFESNRGPGLNKSLPWFESIKNKYQLELLTDIHEPNQIENLSLFDIIQIPAFLCRQTSLLESTILSKKEINIKKGQFVSAWDAENIISKCQQICKKNDITPNLHLTERGYTFGYNQLVVDMRGFQQMASYCDSVIYDVTHSMQTPGKSQGGSKTSGGTREFALSTARAAAATGYVSGFFIETHPDPNKALSDSGVQLSFEDAAKVVDQVYKTTELARSFQ